MDRNIPDPNKASKPQAHIIGYRGSPRKGGRSRAWYVVICLFLADTLLLAVLAANIIARWKADHLFELANILMWPSFLLAGIGTFGVFRHHRTMMASKLLGLTLGAAFLYVLLLVIVCAKIIPSGK